MPARLAVNNVAWALKQPTENASHERSLATKKVPDTGVLNHG